MRETKITCELVEEMGKREGVEKIIVEPYADYEINANGTRISGTGPAVILLVAD